MKLVALFDCKFLGGRPSSSPLTRTQAGGKVTISEAAEGKGEMHNVATCDYDPIMPHNMYRGEELNMLYPAIEIPDAVDAEDPMDILEDPMYVAGMKIVGDLMYHMSIKGRRRRMYPEEEGEILN